MRSGAQNLDSQELARKIFQNKELTEYSKPATADWSSLLDLLRKSWRMCQGVLSGFLGKGCSSQLSGFYLWKAVEKIRGRKACDREGRKERPLRTQRSAGTIRSRSLWGTGRLGAPDPVERLKNGSTRDDADALSCDERGAVAIEISGH